MVVVVVGCQLVASLYDLATQQDVDLEFLSNAKAFKTGLELRLTLKGEGGSWTGAEGVPHESKVWMDIDRQTNKVHA